TILSRSQIVRFNPLPHILIKEYLIKFFKFEEGLAESIAELSQGSLERACKIAESGLLEELNAFIKASWDDSISQKFKVIEKLAKLEKEKLEHFLYLISLWIWSSYLKRKTENFYPQALPQEIFMGYPIKTIQILNRFQIAFEHFLNKELILFNLAQLLQPLPHG
ncbi:MAG: hypothetical protein P3W84_001970, partial [Thermodesulfobacteriaceae bacterium]|nr:hypothetical protein [Thermodesulfobacteriaceae bacterium]